MPTPPHTGPPVRREATEAETKALASPLRLRIMRVCIEPHTNKEIAERLGKDPATTLHHVRTLVDNEFLVPLPPRRGTRGSREIPYETTGRSWTLFTPALSGTMLNTFLEEVALIPAESLDVTRLGLRLSDADREELDARLHALLEEFRLRSEASRDGSAWSVFLAQHPDPNRPPPSTG